MTEKQEQLLREYAAGRLAWASLRQDGWYYGDVLDGLGALGLRAPTATGDGPNAEALARGRKWLRAALAEQAVR